MRNTEKLGLLEAYNISHFATSMIVVLSRRLVILEVLASLDPPTDPEGTFQAAGRNVEDPLKRPSAIRYAVS
jgi:hypothetical protein